MGDKTNITICLDHEVIESLNELPNKSGFINQLLIDYFNTSKKLDEVLAEKKEQAKVIVEEINEIELKVEEARKRDEEMQQAQIKANRTWEESNEYWESIARIQKETMQKDWDIPKEEFDKVFGEFMVALRGNKVKNMIEFLIAREYKMKKGNVDIVYDKITGERKFELNDEFTLNT